jgi:hypothetical protein
MIQNLLSCFCLFFVVASCDNRSEYLKHDIELEKLGACAQVNEAVSIEANTIGERFVFEHCLDDKNTNKETVERSHDTVFVKFPDVRERNIKYKVTLDINTNPEYHFLSIDGNVFSINVKR